jgi:O-antigen/teichoic acid export membrane protein
MSSTLFRSLFSFGSVSLRSLLGFILGVILARYLGIDDFGEYSLLLALFITLCNFLDFGASNAFYTFISKGYDSRLVYVIYTLWLFFQFLIVIFCIYFIGEEGLLFIFRHKDSTTLIVAFSAVFFQLQITKSISYLFESIRMTIFSQTILLVLAVLNVLLIYLANYFGFISHVNIVFVIILSSHLLMALISFFIATRFISFSRFDSMATVKTVLLKYARFCGPLFLISFFSFLFKYFDTWYLQYNGGNSEQAIYSVAFKFASISLMVSTAVVRIVWKEVADLYSQGKEDLAWDFFITSVKIVTVICVTMSALVLPYSELLITNIYGDEYVSAIPAFMILLLYPIFQAIGQVSTVIFYCNEKTKALSVFTILTIPFGILLTYILLNGVTVTTLSSYFPYEISFALAVKGVIFELFSVCLLLYLAAKLLKKKISFIFLFFSIFSSFILSILSYLIASNFSNLYVVIIIHVILFLISWLFVLSVFSEVLLNRSGSYLKGYLLSFLNGRGVN